MPMAKLVLERDCETAVADQVAASRIRVRALGAFAVVAVMVDANIGRTCCTDHVSMVGVVVDLPNVTRVRIHPNNRCNQESERQRRSKKTPRYAISFANLHRCPALR